MDDFKLNEVSIIRPFLDYWVYCKRFGVISNNKYRSGNTLDLSSVILAEST